MSDNNPDQSQQSAKANISAPTPAKRQRTRTKAEDKKKVPPRANGGKSENANRAAKKAPEKKKAATKRKTRGQKKPENLPEKRQLFVKFYMSNGFNATEAALSAGYSKNSIRSIASELLTFPDIQAAIKAEAQSMLKEVDLDKIRWLREVSRIAFSDIKDVVSFDNSGVIVADSETLTKDVSAAIESVEYHESETKFGGTKQVKVKMHSKTKAQEMLGKFLGLLVDKTEVEHTGEVNFTNLTPEEYQAKKAEWLAAHGVKEGEKSGQ